MLRNTQSKFGAVTIFIHWLMAVVVIGQFSFGLYMLSINYYNPLYKVLTHYHKSIGILFICLLGIRLCWKAINSRPTPAPGVKQWEHNAGRLAQGAMLFLLIIVACFGYLISTAKGHSIEVFNWFEVPATITSIEDQEDWAGEFHYWFALSVTIIASIHAIAALKHHFIDKNETLLRMLGKDRR